MRIAEKRPAHRDKIDLAIGNHPRDEFDPG